MQPIVVEAGKNGTPNALRFNQLEQSVCKKKFFF